MIRLTVPEIEPSDFRAVEEVLRSGFLVQGERVRVFEEALGRFLGVGGVVAVGSGTAALHLVLVAAGIGEGDEVLVPDFTFPATANAVIHSGATPVLVDIEPSTFNMDPSAAAECVSPRTAAILPVHGFGRPAELSSLARISEDHGLTLIEDAACALGAEIEGRKCGTLGRAGCFSFHPRKNITTGEGGAVISTDTDLCARVRSLRSHGAEPSGSGWRFTSAGFNYRMTEIGAALGVGQLERLERSMARREHLVAEYRQRLGSLEEVKFPPPVGSGRDAHQSFVVMLDEGVDRDAVIAHMKDRGVETTIGTYALHREPVFQKELGYRTGQLPMSDLAFRQSLTLPLYPAMSEADVHEVCAALRDSIGRAIGGRP